VLLLVEVVVGVVAEIGVVLERVVELVELLLETEDLDEEVELVADLLV
jgi:hypothetical protein